MDWLRSGLLAAQKHAQETAEKAQAMALQASEKAKELAGPALERAKAIAAVAAEEAQSKLQELTRTNEAPTVSPGELIKYGVTDSLKEYVGSMTYSTFSDFPVAALEGTNPLGPHAQLGSSPTGFRLSPWQERHAMLALQNLPQLNHLRFALIPKRMEEEHFWITYFTLVKKFLPPEAFGAPPLTPVLPPPPPVTSSTSALQPSIPSSGGGATAAAMAATAAAAALSSPEHHVAKGSMSTPQLKISHTPSLSKEDSLHKCVSEAVTPLTAAGSTSTPVSPSGDVADDGDAELVDASSSPSGLDDDAHDLEDKLEDDPELAAYLQEALDVEDGDGSDDEASGGEEDLDEYLNQLNDEMNEGDDGEDA